MVGLWPPEVLGRASAEPRRDESVPYKKRVGGLKLFLPLKFHTLELTAEKG